MRTTVDVPDDVYRSVKVLAAERGTTVRELVLEGLEIVMRTRQTPGKSSEPAAPPSAEAGSLEVDLETNDDLIGFP